MQRRAWLQAGAAAVALQTFMAHAASGRRRHALLVGVSALQYQPRSLWLKGPAYDVMHMQRALAAHGFAASDITVLADDGQGAALAGAARPDRAAVMQAFKTVSATLRHGDTLVIYWSGHAVRAAGPSKSVAEPDGKSTFLLTSDAQRLPAANRNAWPLQGAVADAEVGSAIDDCLAAGVHVLAVMDVCHAASATRSSEAGVLWRGLRVSELEALKPGITPEAGLAPGAASLPVVLPAARPRNRGYVGLYACEEMQRTPEWSLHGHQQGAFTHAVAQALLADKASQRYAELARRTLDLHTGLAHSAPVARSLWPAPVFEGSLQGPLWTAADVQPWSAKSAATRPAATALPEGAQLLLHVQQPGGQSKVVNIENLAQGASFLGPLPVGTQFELQVTNAAQQALYLRIFYIGPEGRWQAIYPERAGDAAQLAAASRSAASRWQKTLVVDSAESRPESLLWVLARSDTQALIEDAEVAALPTQAWQMQLSWQSVVR